MKGGATRAMSQWPEELAERVAAETLRIGRPQRAYQLLPNADQEKTHH
jgi:hypothetical protein